MTTFRDLARRVYPDASDEECDYLLWERTGFPAFWRTGNPTRDIAHSLRGFKAAQRRAKRFGFTLCALCDRKAVFPKRRPTECRICRRALDGTP